MNTEIFKQVANKSVDFLKVHSPQILVGVGIVSGAAACVTACVATRKIDTILEPTKEDIQKIKDVHTGAIEVDESYTDEDYKKDLTITYCRAGLKIAKLYAPSIILSAVSITSILAGFNILNKRYSNLAVAYAGLSEMYNTYRKRVKDELGDEMDKHFRLGTEIKEREIETEDSKGKKKKKKVKDTVIDKMPSPYAKFFDPASRCWDKNPENNLYFLRQQQAAANNRLKANGELYLNEVYDMLDIKRTADGQVIGWRYDENNPTGDNYVDFGIYDILYEGSRAFVNGNTNSILLDFNCDGDILALKYAIEKGSKEYERALIDQK